jgi:hypothetical protein
VYGTDVRDAPESLMRCSVTPIARGCVDRFGEVVTREGGAVRRSAQSVFGSYQRIDVITAGRRVGRHGGSGS